MEGPEMDPLGTLHEGLSEQSKPSKVYTPSRNNLGGITMHGVGQRQQHIELFGYSECS
jgi:hypothetical protein